MDSSIGIGDLAAIVTLTGVTIYVLGLVGLAIPIYRTFTGDLATAWYAVSLLPRTVVAGQGVRIWVQWPLLLTVVLLILTIILPALPIPQPFMMSPVLLFLAFFGPYAFVQTVIAVRERSRGWIGTTISWVLAFVSTVYLSGLVSVIVEILSGATDGTTTLHGTTPWPFALLTYFPASFLVGLPMALGARPPLPRVKIARQAEAVMEGHPNLTEGYLVAHRDGFWHVFDDNNDLLSLPDTQVLAVRTVRKEVVAQLPWWGLPWWVPVLVRRLIVIALVGILLLVAIRILTGGRLP